MVTMGEVHTALLRNSVPVSPSMATRLLGFDVSEHVHRSDRPISYVLSQDLLTGVDCQLATPSGSKVRAIGTVISRAAIAGGHVVQGSAYVQMTKATVDRRQPWSHYLAQPGVVETIGRVTPTQIADGFLGQTTSRRVLDLSAIGRRTLDRVQDSKDFLNQEPPFKTQRSRLRWVLQPAGDDRLSITLLSDRDFGCTVVLPDRETAVSEIAALCEDLALHDWLLATVTSMVSRAPIGSGDRSAVIGSLQPALDYLIHLWMPAARIDHVLADVWEAVDRRPAMSRQWQALVTRIRDQLALAAALSLTASTSL